MYYNIPLSWMLGGVLGWLLAMILGAAVLSVYYYWEEVT